VALRLALAQPAGNAAYLARPCQYVNKPSKPCAPRYWTGARFAPEVIAATNEAIDDLKARFGASQLTLVGYSGGAAVAALVAAQRHDVQQLVSVAGNIDHTAWTTLHHLSPLSESLNPLQVRATLGAISQWHFAGSLDRVVPPRLIKSWVQGLPNVQLVVIDGYDHSCCWAENWPQLWATIQ
jgi:pimeloyl-ACP methyl ester carboxylesterase